jgi:hypothetical protein
MTRSRSLLTSLFACAILSVSEASSRAEDARPEPAKLAKAAVDPKAAAEIRDLLISWMKSDGKPEAAPERILWSRYEIDPWDSAYSGDLALLVNRLRRTAAGVFPNVYSVIGTAPHRRARATVDAGRDRFVVLLVEEDGWRAVRADLALSGLPDPVSGTPTDAPSARIAVESLWKAIDNYDTKAFAAACANFKDGALIDVEPKAVEEMLADFHQKYGLRPRRVLAPTAIAGSDEIEVPVLIGDREVLLLCGMRKDAKGAWRLARVSDGNPASVEDEKPADKPAEPAMGEPPPMAPTPPKKDETTPTPK